MVEDGSIRGMLPPSSLNVFVEVLYPGYWVSARLRTVKNCKTPTNRIIPAIL